MNKDEYEILLKAVRKLDTRMTDMDSSITRVENDLADDRKDIDDMKRRLSGVEESNKSITGTLTRFQKKTSEAVKAGVEDAIKPIEKKIDDWLEKKVIRTRPKKRSIIEQTKDYLNSLTDWKKGVEEDGK